MIHPDAHACDNTVFFFFLHALGLGQLHARAIRANGVRLDRTCTIRTNRENYLSPIFWPVIHIYTNLQGETKGRHRITNPKMVRTTLTLKSTTSTEEKSKKWAKPEHLIAQLHFFTLSNAPLPMYEPPRTHQNPCSCICTETPCRCLFSSVQLAQA